MATLLVVDDEPAVLKLIASVLRSEHTVITAESGIEALVIFESYPDRFDLIVTDITMPGMSGLELVARLEEFHKRQFAVLFVTGASDHPVAGFRAVLLKPFRPAGLREAVRKLLQALPRKPVS